MSRDLTAAALMWGGRAEHIYRKTHTQKHKHESILLLLGRVDRVSQRRSGLVLLVCLQQAVASSMMEAKISGRPASVLPRRATLARVRNLSLPVGDKLGLQNVFLT